MTQHCCFSRNNACNFNSIEVHAIQLKMQKQACMQKKISWLLKRDGKKEEHYI